MVSAQINIDDFQEEVPPLPMGSAIVLVLSERTNYAETRFDYYFN